MKRAFLWLDNISLNKKLFMIYVLCIFVPIITFVSLFYSSMNRELKQKRVSELNESLLRIKYGISKEIEIAKSLSDRLLLNESYYTLFENTEESVASRYEYRRKWDQAIQQHLVSNPKVDNITLYTTNHLLFFGGSIQPLTEANKNESWYKELVASGKNMIVTTIPETGRDKVSIVRYMNYALLNNIDVLRISLDENVFAQLALEEAQNAGILQAELYDQHGKPIFTINKGIQEQEGISLKDSFAQSGLLGGWSIMIRGSSSLLTPELQHLKTRFIFLMMGSLMVTSFIIYLITRSMIYRMRILSQQMRNIKMNRFDVISHSPGNDEIGMVIIQFNMMVARMENLISEVYEAELQKNRFLVEKLNAERNALYSQINPHFLYNTLNVMMAKSMLKQEYETVSIIRSLSKLFRRLTVWGSDLIPLGEELEFIREYLNIQKYRFEDKLQYEIEMEHGVGLLLIPKMCLQPLIENACVHGIEKKRTMGTIKLQILDIEDTLSIEISDDGPGMSNEKLDELKKRLEGNYENHKSVGLHNVYKRLGMYYGDDLDFRVISQLGHGTSIFIRIPLLSIRQQGDKYDNETT
ncbi:sensor histidine kinase [Paenibacillus roseipurpureus]|uniref:Sensor histidine kinase n=1 Tax=Paenibacillus roseopurpureus TaxID=2918901 RepID=A0AA96LP98_9BACL|nr:sensor histidine kinase [Paenibacillus sp. MBLB1832]WNR43479.1 sensor histidine kinase [Paenibacillus sp. MBLB1832]